jgi:serralysin
VTNSSFEIYFNGEATQAHIDKVVRSLVYYNTGKAGETTHQIQITASDGADKTATSTVTVTHTGGVTAPVTGGRVNGTAETEVIKGSAKADMIYGGAGDDTIYGGAGKDTLRGDAGKDVFVFDTRPSKSNIDTIKSYKTRDDSIWLENSVFTKLGRGTPENPQKLASKAFWAGEKAHDANDRIIYNKKTGALYYDQDGTGSNAAVQFATIDKNLKMNASEFFVI